MAASVERPVIAVVPTLLVEEERQYVNYHYLQAIEAAGGAPLILPLSENQDVYDSLFPFVDGFILTGGNDIDPECYGGDNTSDKLSEITPLRDAVEYLILSYAYSFDIPTLGICRGMQMMNVFFGGTLYEDLSEQFDGPRGITSDMLQHQQKGDYEKPSHFVDIVRDTKLGRILQTDRIAANSMHHQGVQKLASRLEAVAYGPDGLVEAVEVKDRTFIMGVQWHPEYFAGTKNMGCIFATLVDQAGLKSSSRPHSREELAAFRAGMHAVKPQGHLPSCVLALWGDDVTVTA